MSVRKIMISLVITTLLSFFPIAGFSLDILPNHARLQETLREVVKTKNGGFGLHMWATVVDRDGVVQSVVFSGRERSDQWPGSRVISAQKANTANAFSLPGLALSTANLYSAVQPGWFPVRSSAQQSGQHPGCLPGPVCRNRESKGSNGRL